MRFSASNLSDGYEHAPIQDNWTWNLVRNHFLRSQYLKTDIPTKQSKWIFDKDFYLLIDTVGRLYRCEKI